MLEKGKTHGAKTSGALLEITHLPDRKEGALEVRRLLRPGMGFTVPHLHVDFEERFTIEEGVADARVGNRRLRLAPGDVFNISPHTVHVVPCNRSNRDLVVLQQFRPGEPAIRYIETLARFLDEDRDWRGDLPPLAALAMLSTRYPGTYAPLVAKPVQRHVMFPIAKSLQQRLDDRRVIKQEERKAAEAWEYGYWAEDKRRRRGGHRRRLTYRAGSELSG